MKLMLLISLLCLTLSCADKGKKSDPQSSIGLPSVAAGSNGSGNDGQQVTIPVVSEEVANNQLADNNNQDNSSSTDTSTNDDVADNTDDTSTNDDVADNTDDTSTNDDVADNTDDTSTNDDVADNTDDSSSNEEEPVVAEPTALVCEFSNENEKTTLSLLLKDKMVVLKDSKSDGKLTFDRHIFSPSANQNAAVHHEDKDFSIEEGKVIKITARLVMSDDLSGGELQVNYRVKSGKKTTETGHRKLADVSDCKQE